jgi:succinylarginine dihydrolase
MKDKSLLKIVADNPNLLQTLKEHILEEFEVEVPQSDLGVTDEVLGQIFRARLVGKNKIDNAFKKVLNYKTVEVEAEKINIAR